MLMWSQAAMWPAIWHARWVWHAGAETEQCHVSILASFRHPNWQNERREWNGKWITPGLMCVFEIRHPRQRWVNWISLPSVPVSSAAGERRSTLVAWALFWEIKHLSAQLAAEDAVLSLLLAVSFSSVYMWELWEAPFQAVLPGGIALCEKKKIVNKILCFTAACLSTLPRPGICCSIHYTPLKQFVPLRHFKEMWLGVFPRPIYDWGWGRADITDWILFSQG